MMVENQEVERLMGGLEETAGGMEIYLSKDSFHSIIVPQCDLFLTKGSS